MKCCNHFLSSLSLSFSSRLELFIVILVINHITESVLLIGKCWLFALLWKLQSGNFRQSHSVLIKNIIIIFVVIKQNHHHHYKKVCCTYTIYYISEINLFNDSTCVLRNPFSYTPLLCRIYVGLNAPNKGSIAFSALFQCYIFSHHPRGP